MSHVPCYLVDANILLRYLTKDHTEHSPAAKRLFDAARKGDLQLEMPYTSIAETIYTLAGQYKRKRHEISEAITALISGVGVKVVAPGWLLDALEEYRNGKASFGDSCIGAEARSRGVPVASFDSDFDRMVGVTRFEPK